MRVLLVLLALVAGHVRGAGAQAARAPVVPASPVVPVSSQAKGPVALEPSQELRKGFSAFPRLQAGGEVTAAVAAKVNASLARLDTSAGKALAECSKTAKQHQGEAEWAREMDVTMRGPRFLSLVASDLFDCGDGHPNQMNTLAIVYDLTTGAPVNWLKYFPAGVKSDLGPPEDGEEGVKVGMLSWPPLTKEALRQAEKGCKDQYAYDDSVSFQLWLDARSGQVAAQPSSRSPDPSRCDDGGFGLSVSQARRIGLHGSVLAALEAAHRLQQ